MRISKIDYEILITAGKILLYLIDNDLLKGDALTDSKVKEIIENL